MRNKFASVCLPTSNCLLDLPATCSILTVKRAFAFLLAVTKKYSVPLCGHFCRIHQTSDRHRHPSPSIRTGILSPIVGSAVGTPRFGTRGAVNSGGAGWAHPSNLPPCWRTQDFLQLLIAIELYHFVLLIWRTMRRVMALGGRSCTMGFG